MNSYTKSLLNNRFYKRAIGRQQSREVSTSPQIRLPELIEEQKDLNSPTTPNIKIPIFTETRFIQSIQSSASPTPNSIC